MDLAISAMVVHGVVDRELSLATAWLPEVDLVMVVEGDSVTVTTERQNEGRRR